MSQRLLDIVQKIIILGKSKKNVLLQVKQTNGVINLKI